MKDVRQALRLAIRLVKGVDLDPGVADVTLTDLELDSLDLIEVGMIVEQHLDVMLDPDMFASCETFEQFVSVVRTAMDDDERNPRG